MSAEAGGGMSAGDIAGLVGAGAAWVGVLVSWRLAIRAERAQKAAQGHADRAQAKGFAHAEELQEKDHANKERLVMQENLRKEADREQEKQRKETERKAAHAQQARELFGEICGLLRIKSGGGSNIEDANVLADKLCRHLGSDAHARYVSTAAMLYFLKGRDEPNRDELAKIKTARDTVEAHLSDPEASWTMPTDDVVQTFGKGSTSAPGLKDRLWIVKPTD